MRFAGKRAGVKKSNAPSVRNARDECPLSHLIGNAGADAIFMMFIRFISAVFIAIFGGGGIYPRRREARICDTRVNSKAREHVRRFNVLGCNTNSLSNKSVCGRHNSIK